MNVTFLTPSLHIGGAERWILSLARHLRRARPHALFLLGAHQHPAMRREAERLFPVYEAAHGRDLSAARSMLWRACEGADAIVSWGIPQLRALRRDLDLPVIEVSHSDGSWPQQTALVARSAQGADYLAAVSKTAVSAFPEALRGSATVIYNGAEVDRVAPRIARAAQRRRWGLPQEARVALFLGRLAEVKQPEMLLRALPHLPQAWRAVFVGHGPLDAELRDLARRIAPDRCRFFPATTAVGDCLAAADAFVMPSRCEGMPLALIEAFFAGTPAVASDCAAVRELLERHGSLCATIPAANDEASGRRLAAALEDALAAHDAQERIDRARGAAWNHYTAAAMAERWEEYLAAVVRDWNGER